MAVHCAQSTVAFSAVAVARSQAELLQQLLGQEVIRLVTVIQSVKAATDSPAQRPLSSWSELAPAAVDGGWGRYHSWLLAEFTVVAIPRPRSPTQHAHLQVLLSLTPWLGLDDVKYWKSV